MGFSKENMGLLREKNLESDCGFIVAYRRNYNADQNIRRGESLFYKLLDSGCEVIEMKSNFLKLREEKLAALPRVFSMKGINNRGQPGVCDEELVGHFVVTDRCPDLKEKLLRLGVYFEQRHVLFIPKGSWAVSNGQAVWLSTDPFATEFGKDDRSDDPVEPRVNLDGGDVAVFDMTDGLVRSNRFVGLSGRLRVHVSALHHWSREHEVIEFINTGFAQAVAFAMERHGKPGKGSDIPYISHLMGVSSLVLEYGGNEDEAIAGLLHDVVEDTETTVEEVRELFGGGVADIVAGCSETKCIDGSSEERPWKDRKDDYIAHIQELETPPGVLLVSMADKLHCLQTILHDYRRIGDALWERFNPAAGKEGTLWFYRTLVDSFKAHSHANLELARELDCITTELERFISMTGRDQ